MPPFVRVLVSILSSVVAAATVARNCLFGVVGQTSYNITFKIYVSRSHFSLLLDRSGTRYNFLLYSKKYTSNWSICSGSVLF